MRAIPILLLLGALTACSTPRAASHAVPSPSAGRARVTPPAIASDAPAAAPPPAPPAASATEPEAPPLALPAVPAGADAEKVVFAASICAAAVRPISKTRLAVGCRSHPPFDTPEQKPDGKLPHHAGDPLTFCALETVYRGSFTRAGAKQAVLAFGQCKENDPDATWDAGFPGSAVLVEEVSGRWKPVAYELGVNAGSCLAAHRKDGRDVLFCRSGFGAGAIGSVTYVFLMDLGRTEKRVGSVIRLFADESGCGYFDVPGATGPRRLPSGLITVRITEMRVLDRNNDGTGDLVVQVERARVLPSAALDTRLERACKTTMLPNNLPLFPQPTKTQLEIVSQGSDFKPSAETRKLLETWEAEAPDGLAGLAGAAPAPFQ